MSQIVSLRKGTSDRIQLFTHGSVLISLDPMYSLILMLIVNSKKGANDPEGKYKYGIMVLCDKISHEFRYDTDIW